MMYSVLRMLFVVWIAVRRSGNSSSCKNSPQPISVSFELVRVLCDDPQPFASMSLWSSAGKSLQSTRCALTHMKRRRCCGLHLAYKRWHDVV